MSYDDHVERAFAAGDIDALLRFAYGYPCACTRGARLMPLRWR
jgi:hypothetical protein